MESRYTRKYPCPPFEPFLRAKNTTNIEGTGLGLVIVKNNVEALDGTIQVKSQEGVGITFIVHLLINTT